MFTVNDTFNTNGITKAVFAIDKNGDRSLTLFDFMGKKSVLDSKYYTKVFSKVFDALQQQFNNNKQFAFTLDGYGWGIKTQPGTDVNAAVSAFNKALGFPD